METDVVDEQIRQSPLTNVRRKIPRPTLTPRQSERALLSDSSSSERASFSRLTGLARWFRTSKDQCSIDIESGGSELGAYLRKSSVGSQRGRGGSQGIGRSFQRARRGVERRLGRLGIGKGKKKVGGIEEVSGSCKKNFKNLNYF